jgi:hypothetical protein
MRREPARACLPDEIAGLRGDERSRRRADLRSERQNLSHLLSPVLSRAPDRAVERLGARLLRFFSRRRLLALRLHADPFLLSATLRSAFRHDRNLSDLSIYAQRLELHFWANVKDEPRPCLAPKAAPQPTCQAGSLALATGWAGFRLQSWLRFLSPPVQRFESRKCWFDIPKRSHSEPARNHCFESLRKTSNLCANQHRNASCVSHFRTSSHAKNADLL